MQFSTLSVAFFSLATLIKADAISQIGDGQIQAATTTTEAPRSTVAAVSQITDGQIQATTSTHAVTEQTTNGAAKAVVGAGALAAFAAYLL
ncbi:hypothetical protein Kpol_431p6 [Vanderwaltozyma polyspora DSM 70294]|uniref:Protein TOS6 n=1 Tax=Vanderwaltozyma polyspora (strain ATCC 22028 / DSM 70294 / BCRC 21397 / CBS 2163 / NBRC 10782 / NRRL Y-8283 / UCD 57-17) TaxID=436907 RepID=A7TRM7_VANPO|nr:uncharacterized protein Kpol_431p6 [Vanderwaltozyma polyspora DSM 70294]EDO15079.1 hypothetical protein Kpol_431p6 [Vanderwaltozyma polyspora DSM 70294]